MDDGFLCCSVCMEEYNEDEKAPQLLNCSHTFCSKCIRHFPSLECPECNKTFVIEDCKKNQEIIRCLRIWQNQLNHDMPQKFNPHAAIPMNGNLVNILGDLNGNLYKRRGGFGKHMLHAWHLRRFVLCDGMLCYYDHGSTTQPRGKIDFREDLYSVQSGKYIEGSPTTFTLQITPLNKSLEKWNICAISQAELEIWREAIEKSCTYYSCTTPKEKSECIVNQNFTSGCCVCLESKGKGIRCSNEHFICNECFTPYVTSIVSDGGKFVDAGYTICCPIPHCISTPWNSHHIRLLLDGKSLETYIDALVKHANISHQTDQQNMSDHKQTVLDALNIGCPKCHALIDPTPDGCCAMRCLHCSCYFCLLCLHTSPDSPSCHLHVSKCPRNPGGDIFANEMVRKTAYMQLQIASVVAKLQNIFGVTWNTNDECRSLVSSCHTDLQQNGIEESAIFRSPPVNGVPPIIVPQNIKRLRFTYFAYGVALALVIVVLFRWIVGSWTSSSPIPSGGEYMYTERIKLDGDAINEGGKQSVLSGRYLAKYGMVGAILYFVLSANRVQTSLFISLTWPLIWYAATSFIYICWTLCTVGWYILVRCMYFAAVVLVVKVLFDLFMKKIR